MNLAIQFGVLGILQLFIVGYAEGCITSPECEEKLDKCKTDARIEGLKSYEQCLASTCRQCKLCGLCNDGVSHVIRATKDQRLQCLSAHNKLRKLHEDTPPLEWDEELAQEAQKYAEHLVNELELHHGAVGENMFLKCGSNGTTVQSCNEASNAWYSEIQHYDYDTANTRHETEMIGHFAQVVWKSNRKLGVGIAVHEKTKFVYVIGRYGNYVNSDVDVMKENVKPLKAH